MSIPGARSSGVRSTRSSRSGLSASSDSSNQSACVITAVPRGASTPDRFVTNDRRVGSSQWLSTEKTAQLYQDHPEYFRTDPNAIYRSIINLERNADEVITSAFLRFDAQFLERRLKPLTGVEAVSVDLIGQRLHVTYDAAKLTTAAMVDAVGQMPLTRAEMLKTIRAFQKLLWIQNDFISRHYT